MDHTGEGHLPPNRPWMQSCWRFFGPGLSKRSVSASHGLGRKYVWIQYYHTFMNTEVLVFIWAVSGKESACNAGDAGSSLGSERSPGGGNGNPLQYSCRDNPMHRGAWRATVHRVTESQTWLSTHMLALNVQINNYTQPSTNGVRSMMKKR